MVSKDADFKVRLTQSGQQTNRLMNYLRDIGHFHSFREAIKQEDLLGIDYWVQFSSSDELHPIQFKLRVEQGKHDFPVVYRQPFYGWDVAESSQSNQGLNKLGRDYKGIVGQNSEYYYVAVKGKNNQYDRIYRIKNSALRSLIEKLDNDWNAVEQFVVADGYEMRSPWFTYRREKLTKDRIASLSGKMFQNEVGEVWLQKNDGEKFHKINFYINESFKEDEFQIQPSI